MFCLDPPNHLSPQKSVITKMRSIVRIWLVVMVVVMLVPAAWTAELLKLPQLWQHYQAHKQLDGGLTFYGYLTEHYGGQMSESQRDSGEHERLPFKKMAQTDFSFFVGKLSTQTPSVWRGVGASSGGTFTLKKILFPVKSRWLQSASGKDIWQPPKIGA